MDWKSATIFLDRIRGPQYMILPMLWMQKVSHKCHFYSPFFPHPMISEILSIKVTFGWISINSFCWMESHQMSADAENMKKLGAWKSAAIEGMAASRGAVVSGFQRQLLHPPRHHHTTRQTHWPSPHLVSCALPEPGFHWEEGIPYHTCKWFEDIFGTGNCIYWKVKPDM